MTAFLSAPVSHSLTRESGRARRLPPAGGSTPAAPAVVGATDRPVERVAPAAHHAAGATMRTVKEIATMTAIDMRGDMTTRTIADAIRGIAGERVAPWLEMGGRRRLLRRS